MLYFREGELVLLRKGSLLGARFVADNFEHVLVYDKYLACCDRYEEAVMIRRGEGRTIVAILQSGQL